MKQERTQNPQQKKQYPLNPQARSAYRVGDEHPPGQRPIGTQEDSKAGAVYQNPIVGAGNRGDHPQTGQKFGPGQDAQTREDIQRAEQEGMVKHKEANRAEGSDKSHPQPKELSAQHGRGDTSARQQKSKSQGKSSSRRQHGASTRHH
jgi:hypothetical protein